MAANVLIFSILCSCCIGCKSLGFLGTEHFSPQRYSQSIHKYKHTEENGFHFYEGLGAWFAFHPFWMENVCTYEISKA